MSYLKYFKLSTLSLTILSVVACSGTNQEEVIRNLYGKKLNLPELPELLRNRDYSSMVLVYINAEGCTPCKLKNIYDWKLIERKQSEWLENDSIKSKLCFIIETSGNISEARQSVDLFFYNANVIYDSLFTFNNNNVIPKDSKYHIFLLNRNDEILLIGSPLMNQDMLKLYEINIKRIHNAHKVDSIVFNQEF